MYFVIDIEADALDNPKNVWCIVAKNIETGEVYEYEPDTVKQGIEFLHRTATGYIGHNLIGWDRGVILNLLGVDIHEKDVIDTLVLSRLLKFNLDDGHSLEAWGSRLKFAKGNFTDFAAYSKEMLAYCRRDVELTHLVYNYLMSKLGREEFKQAIQVEHEMAWICQGMHDDGFSFDVVAAKKLHASLSQRLAAIDLELLTAFPPKAKLVRVVTPKLTKHGTLSRVGFPKDWTDLTEFSADCPFSLVTWEPFNPGSPKQIVDRLWDAGWAPTDKTKGHLECENTKEKERLEHFKRYGWKVNEVNLATVPDTAPPAAHRLVERLLLAGRHRTLEEWFRHCHMQIEIPVTSVNESTTQIIKKDYGSTIGTIITNGTNKVTDEDDPILNKLTGLHLKTLIVWLRSKGANVKSVIEKKSSVLIIVIPVEKLEASSVSSATVTLDGLKTIGVEYNVISASIHASINHIGTWTGRMSHTSPNLGNIATAKSIKYRSDHLQAEAVALGSHMRALWTCDKEDEDSFLVGTDAVGIQLRIFAHYINDPIFTEALINGSSKHGTDAHSLNANLLGCSRDTAKTFIYAFLLGAGDAKVAEILQVRNKQGRQAKQRFIEAYPGLQKLRTQVVPYDARRGYFQTFDGRYIVCDSEHLMMAGYLQAGEMCIMKHANVLWRQWADEQGIPYKQRNFVHDEWQTTTSGEQNAQTLGELQCKAIAAIGLHFKLNCPMAGETRYGRNWYETH